ncbi:MAG: DNA polymerase III subunit delta, partial [Planctomycetota bacterium]
MDKPIYVIAGKEESLVNAQCRELLDELLEPSQRATGLFDADPASVSPSDVFDELRTVPFLADNRVVLIRQADDFISKHRELLEKYFDNPCPTGKFILTVKTWKANTKLAKKLKKAGKLINVAQPKQWELPQRLIKYANEAYDKRLSRDAAELLIELTGDELTRLYSEIDKLALFADKEKAITPTHIESLIGHNRLFNAFAVIDAIIAGRPAEAVGRLRGMFASDKSAEYTVVGAFAFHFRRMFSAKVLLEKGLRRSEIEKSLRIWYNKEGFFAQLDKMSLKQIGKYLQKLAETDYAIKTGRAKAPIAMEQL